MSSLTVAWRKTRDRVHHVGLPWAVQTIFERIVPSWLLGVGRFAIFETEISRRATGPENTGVRWAGMEDIPRLAVSGQSLQTMQRRLEVGEEAVFLEVPGGTVVAYGWYAFHHYNEYDWLRVDLKEDEVWCFDNWVVPEHRGERLMGRLRGAGLAHFASRGATRVLSAVDVTNHSSIRSTLKLGARRIGVVTFFRVLGVTWVCLGGRHRVGRWVASRRLTVSRDDLVDPRRRDT